MRQRIEIQDSGGPYLRSGQVAERAGVNLQTLRYYERRGLIADLNTIRRALSAVVSAGCDSLTHCTCPDCPLPFADLAATCTSEES
ncbi:MerR family DNA-binding transcriptional regulator [Nonomuraea angiospora]|uniref:MerR family DNA-binding transcriptional regulator n=1 Tax=Nonomuraea angiospora TaxID=46172 RepID=UPI00379558FA